MCDLLWADPMEEFNMDPGEKYAHNSLRGCSWSFSYSAVLEFLDRNKLLSVIRAHEAQDTGYKMHRKNDKTGFPSVITLFSAPNYLGSYGNKAAIMKYDNNVINIRQFNASDSPYYLPGFMNVFAWSIPFVAEKLGDILTAVGKLVDDELVEENIARFISLRQKVTAVVRITQAFKKIREEREKIIKAGPLSPQGFSLPSTLSDNLNETLEKSLQSFQGVRSIDLPNEARPPESPKPAAIPSSETLKRHMSRDHIIQRKRTLPKIPDKVKGLFLSESAPLIKEEKI